MKQMFRLNVEKSFVKRPEPFKTFIRKLLLAGVNEWRIPSFRGWSHLHLTVEQKKGGEFFFRRLFFPNFYNFFRFLQLRFCFAWFCFFQVFLLSQFFFSNPTSTKIGFKFFCSHHLSPGHCAPVRTSDAKKPGSFFSGGFSCCCCCCCCCESSTTAQLFIFVSRLSQMS